ncbi:hypothetical protein K449DRAFT_433841 [Hypoxylon sp. EC38]|nr:hypothetical protein K449DRAFT_433841 [Hypoxylon sp. EC38]
MSFTTALTWSNLDAKSRAIYNLSKVDHDVEEPRGPSSLEEAVAAGGAIYTYLTFIFLLCLFQTYPLDELWPPGCPASPKDGDTGFGRCELGGYFRRLGPRKDPRNLLGPRYNNVTGVASYLGSAHGSWQRVGEQATRYRRVAKYKSRAQMQHFEHIIIDNKRLLIMWG